MRDKSSAVTMNRLSPSQIIASFAVLLLSTGAALMMGASPFAVMLPVLAGVIVLAITAEAGTPRRDVPKVTLDEPDLIDHPDFASLLEGISDPLMLVERGRIARVNRAAQRLLGAHIEGRMRASPFAILPPPNDWRALPRWPNRS